MPAMPDLNDEEFLELRVLLRHTIAADPYPLSPRVKRLRAILDKLDPPPPQWCATLPSNDPKLPASLVLKRRR